MRVLLISHTCQSATEGQPKAFELARFDDIELMVLVPRRWKHYGSWREPQTPSDPPFRWREGRVAWPWVGPAQNYLHWYPEMPAILRRFSPDVIDLWEEAWGAVSAHVCFLRPLLAPRARIVTETEQNIEKVLPPPFETFRSYTFSRADYLVARSDEALSVARSKGFRGPGSVVPNAVDAALFVPSDRLEAARELRARLGLSDDARVLGYVGRLVREKGLLDLVAALCHLPLHVHAVLVGDGPLREEIINAARAAGVDERLHLVGPRPLTELPQWMNGFDVLTLPSLTTASWKEQFGRVLIEAQACATPVLGSDSGAIPQVVGECGLTFPEGNARALAAKAQQLLDDRALWERCSRTGPHRVNESFTWAKVAAAMRSVYLEVASSKPIEHFAGKDS